MLPSAPPPWGTRTASSWLSNRVLSAPRQRNSTSGPAWPALASKLYGRRARMLVAARAGCGGACRAAAHEAVPVSAVAPATTMPTIRIASPRQCQSGPVEPAPLLDAALDVQQGVGG